MPGLYSMQLQFYCAASSHTWPPKKKRAQIIWQRRVYVLGHSSPQLKGEVKSLLSVCYSCLAVALYQLQYHSIVVIPSQYQWRLPCRVCMQLQSYCAASGRTWPQAYIVDENSALFYKRHFQCFIMLHCIDHKPPRGSGVKSFGSVEFMYLAIVPHNLKARSNHCYLFAIHAWSQPSINCSITVQSLYLLNASGAYHAGFVCSFNPIAPHLAVLGHRRIQLTKTLRCFIRGIFSASLCYIALTINHQKKAGSNHLAAQSLCIWPQPS